ncbi:hypothetical protein BDR05DRAFT_478384 [Suillus weaverae]|nr:hypothetical protein BDR05DRAFT_478384 [Suillus weaverae]
MSLKSLQFGTRRQYLLLVGQKQLVKRPDASRTQNCGFVLCCFSAVSLLAPMTALPPTRLVAAHKQLFYFCHSSSLFATTPLLTVFNIMYLVRLNTSTYFYTDFSLAQPHPT